MKKISLLLSIFQDFNFSLVLKKLDVPSWSTYLLGPYFVPSCLTYLPKNGTSLMDVWSTFWPSSHQVFTNLRTDLDSMNQAKHNKIISKVIKQDKNILLYPWPTHTWRANIWTPRRPNMRVGLNQKCLFFPALYFFKWFYVFHDF